nr:unnamed protein product [Callosobruchus chinensis]
MSNLMCHKLKAHQRTEKPKYVCQICEYVFPKRMSLREHEQYSHGLIDPPSRSPRLPGKKNYMNAIIVDPIKTDAMRLALESNQTPFALLRPVTGIPVLVRVLPAGDKQMLVPASAEDLKKHSHISVTPKELDSNKENAGIVIHCSKKLTKLLLSICNFQSVSYIQMEHTYSKRNTFSRNTLKNITIIFISKKEVKIQIKNRIAFYS